MLSAKYGTWDERGIDMTFDSLFIQNIIATSVEKQFMA